MVERKYVAGRMDGISKYPHPAAEYGINACFCTCVDSEGPYQGGFRAVCRFLKHFGIHGVHVELLHLARSVAVETTQSPPVGLLEEAHLYPSTPILEADPCSQAIPWK